MLYIIILLLILFALAAWMKARRQDLRMEMIENRLDLLEKEVVRIVNK